MVVTKLELPKATCKRWEASSISAVGGSFVEMGFDVRELLPIPEPGQDSDAVLDGDNLVVTLPPLPEGAKWWMLRHSDGNTVAVIGPKAEESPAEDAKVEDPAPAEDAKTSGADTGSPLPVAYQVKFSGYMVGVSAVYSDGSTSAMSWFSWDTGHCPLHLLIIQIAAKVGCFRFGGSRASSSDSDAVLAEIFTKKVPFYVEQTGLGSVAIGKLRSIGITVNQKE